MKQQIDRMKLLQQGNIDRLRRVNVRVARNEIVTSYVKFSGDKLHFAMHRDRFIGGFIGTDRYFLSRAALIFSL